MALSDKEKLILGWSGGIVTLILGYLVWRHEQTISQSDAANNAAVQAANDANLANQLEQAVSTQYPVGTGGYASSPATASVDTGSQIDSASTDTALEAILQAFYPTSGSGTTAPPASTAPPIYVSTPVSPVQPVGRPLAPTASPSATSGQPIGAPVGVTRLPLPVATSY